MKIEIYNAKNRQYMATLDKLTGESTILDVKKELQRLRPKLYPERQSYRLEPRGRILKDEESLKALGVESTEGKLYFKDLGPQVGWTTVFVTEYSGPLLIYPLFYLRPAILYGEGAADKPYAPAVHLACACWSLHYLKRVLETIFLHRFSHATMPIRNIFKNSIYYWGFTCLVAYFINHPLYTPAYFGDRQIYGSFIAFLLCEYGNFICHVTLARLRSPGTKERKIPMPTGNPFSWMFSLVSCANYTYEVGAWISFTVMTQALGAGLFSLLGFAQMALWAVQKHKRYLKEFKDYPRRRKAILPFFF